MNALSNSDIFATSRCVRRAVGAIVVYNNTILLVRKIRAMDTTGGPTDLKGEWLFPMGGHKPNETAINALRRELMEELGISDLSNIIQISDFKFLFPKWYYDRTGFSSQIAQMYLASVTDILTLRPDGMEIDAAKFFSLSEADRILSHETAKVYLRSVLNRILQFASITDDK